MYPYSRKMFICICVLGAMTACSDNTNTVVPNLVDLPGMNDKTVKTLDQTQLDTLCAQSQQAGLVYMARHQSNLCGTAALLAEEMNGLNCSEEYDKCMSIDIPTELIDLCTTAKQGCACGWDKAKSTSVFNCHDTVTEFGACLAEIYETVEQTHNEITVSCSDKDSVQKFWETSADRVPPCVEDVFPSCILVWELSWSFDSESLYHILYP